MAKKRKKKDTSKLRRRNSLDFIFQETKDVQADIASTLGAMRRDKKLLPAMKRLEALKKKDQTPGPGPMTLDPVDPADTNWVELGPLAITNGQTYGGADVIVTGRVTVICAHPTNSDIIYLGSSRGGVWKSIDGGENWKPRSDHTESLAIGALDIANSNPQVLYAGTGEGNLQFYSTEYALSSAPGIYLGIGVLKSTDGGNTWVNQGATLFANESFYRVTIDPANADRVFAATSLGICRTTNGSTWTQLTGGGLPAISDDIIACTDVLIDATDASGNTVFAAFWGDGIYKSTNALAATPTWTKITTGLPAASAISRIRLAQAPSSPNTKFALFASASDAFHSVCKTTNAAGTSWTQIFNSVVQLYGAFTCYLSVDPTTPDTLYVSGVELYKATLSAGSWNVVNIGANIHPDSHAFAFDPNDNQTIYSGNDGGIFKSTNGGTNWDDRINIGLNLLQYEAIDDYPGSDAIVLGGTQDNGTNSFRNNPVFYHSDDGDGGYCAINEVNGDQQISSYYGKSFKRSTTGAQFGSWASIAGGIIGNGLFYPPLAKSPTSSRVAVGTNRINVNDTPYGAISWTQVILPGMLGRVSAVSFADNDTIYAASTNGQVYRCTFSAGAWSAQRLDAAPLPGGWIWDVIAFPGNINQVLVVFANFGLAAHAWTGAVPAAGTATWTAASGAGATALPDVPYYAIAFEDANTIYLGSDIGVFKTTNAGGAWTSYSQGLPNTAIYDLRFLPGQKLLRAATHGRGLWEIKTDAIPSPTADLYLRDHVMHTGRMPSSGIASAGFADPLQHISLNDNVYWWQSVDIKVDAPTSVMGGYQFAVSDVDYVVYETELEHRNPDKGNVNRVYVRVQNRGPGNATDVQVKIMYAGASAGLPDLPADFWTQFPNDPVAISPWNPVGATQTIPLLEPCKPVILEWDWNPVPSADTHSCMLVVTDSATDPIPAASKVFNIAQLVTQEKRVALKNLHLVNVVPELVSFIPFHFNILKQWPYQLRIVFDRRSELFYTGLIFPKELAAAIREQQSYRGFKIRKFGRREIQSLKKQWIEQEYKDPEKVERYLDGLDLRYLFVPASRAPMIKIDGNQELKEVNALMVAANRKKTRSYCKFSIIQQGARKQIEGGSTFILRTWKRG